MKFMNIARRFGAYQEQANDGSQGGGGGGADNQNDGGTDNNESPIPSNLSDADIQRIAAAIAAQNGDGDKSRYEKLKDQQRDEDERRARDSEIANNVIFDREFDSLIDTNKALFTMTSAQLRDGTDSLESGEKIDAIKKTAAKNFFDTDENLNLLSKADQEYVKSNIVGKHERSIDGARAWSLVEAAIHVSNRINQHKDYKKSNGDDESETPNVDAWIERARKQ
ncbi:TPA: hypothetical protein P0E12_004983 [Vibrio harveyi]|nr:hypothetical protein [Vibrio harveyi]